MGRFPSVSDVLSSTPSSGAGDDSPRVEYLYICCAEEFALLSPFYMLLDMDFAPRTKPQTWSGLTLVARGSRSWPAGLSDLLSNL